MPEPDGFKLCRMLRTNMNFVRTPIIIVTALNNEDSKVVALGAGANDYLTKPFHIDVPLTIVAVIGMGHMNGLERALTSAIDEDDLREISHAPPRATWGSTLLTHVALPCALLATAWWVAGKYKPSLRLLL